jgi:DNA-binding NarL/FixJ family response regulator
MSLTERERTILQLARQGLSDYKIARRINIDPPSVTRSRKNAQRKLTYAASDINWAMRAGITVSEPNLYKANSLTPMYTFFL